MDRAVGRDGGGSAGEGQIEIPPCGRVGVRPVGEAHLLGEGVGVQPVDQALSPARDDGGLGVVDMRVDEAGRDEAFAVVGDSAFRMRGAQLVRRSQGGDPPVLDKHAAAALPQRRVLDGNVEGAVREAESLAQNQRRGSHVGIIAQRPRPRQGPQRRLRRPRRREAGPGGPCARPQASAPQAFRGRLRGVAWRRRIGSGAFPARLRAISGRRWRPACAALRQQRFRAFGEVDGAAGATVAEWQHFFLRKRLTPDLFC